MPYMPTKSLTNKIIYLLSFFLKCDILWKPSYENGVRGMRAANSHYVLYTGTVWSLKHYDGRPL